MLYAAAGVTTAHEGATHAAELALMKRAAAGGATIIDVIAYPFITDLDAVLKDNPVAELGQVRQPPQDRRREDHDRRLAAGQDRVLHHALPDRRPGRREGLARRADVPAGVVNKAVKAGVRPGRAAEPARQRRRARSTRSCKAHEAAAAGDLAKDRHVTMIHAQFTRKDQLDKYVQYKITPSFYTLHTYYFAEAHIANRGKEQAMYISPMRDAIDKGLRPTNHTDFVVAPLDQMFMLWSAVNRVSRGGAVIGADQRVTPLEALKAMTINVADQYGEQTTKGSLEPGKLADLVILDRNPLKVEPMAIKDIKVVETIKEGKTIFQAK